MCCDEGLLSRPTALAQLIMELTSIKPNEVLMGSVYLRLEREGWGRSRGEEMGVQRGGGRGREENMEESQGRTGKKGERRKLEQLKELSHMAVMIL